MNKAPVKQVEIHRVKQQEIEAKPDILAVEEPMEIRLTWFENNKPIEKSIAVTMRTPGNDLELALGFLFTEGIIKHNDDVERIWHCETVEKEEERGNVVKVNLKPEVEFDFQKQERHFYTSSSCGVCGKSSIESVAQNCSVLPSSDFHVTKEVISSLPEALEADQTVFKYTGGIHASALFDLEGKLQLMREDVGRHNALDKIAGASLSHGEYPLSQSILLVSGRASFELVQKALMLQNSNYLCSGCSQQLGLRLGQIKQHDSDWFF